MGESSSFHSLCLVVRVLVGWLGQKSPHTLKWCWDKIADDTQLTINLLPLHNLTNRSTDKEGFGNCMNSGQVRKAQERLNSRYREATVTESPQDTTAIAQKPQPSPVHTDRFTRTTESTTSVQQTSPPEFCQSQAQAALPEKTAPFLLCTTQQGGPGHRQRSQLGNLSVW